MTDRNNTTRLAQYPDQRPGSDLAVAGSSQEMEQYRDGYGYGAGPPKDFDDEEFSLLDIWRMVVRHRWMILGITAMVLVVVLIGTLLMTPMYRATAVVQIEQIVTNITQFRGVTPEENRTNNFYQTQYELLKSRSLAKRVIDQLGLDSAETATSSKAAGSFFRDIKKTITRFFRKDLSQQSKQAQQASSKAFNITSRFLSGLKIKPVKRSRLVQVSYESPDPALAAHVANAIVNNYIKITLERRFNASSYAKTFLTERIKRVRATLDDSERKLANYMQGLGIINLQKQETMLSLKLQQLSTRLIEAGAEKIKAEAKYRESLQSADDGILEILADTVIQDLKQQRAKLDSEYQTNLKIYRPAYPAMEKLQSQIDKVNEEIKRQTRAIRSAIKSEYLVKLREETDLKQRVAEARKSVLDLRANSTERTALERNVETNRVLYSDLLKRLKEVGVASGSGTNNISVVDAAEVPQRPFSPNLRLNLLLALLGGLFVGGLLAFVFDILDDTIKGSDELENKLQLAVLGIIPEVEASAVDETKNIVLQSLGNLRSAIAEAHRSLRTALLFSTTEGAPKVLHVASASPGEGKTTTSIGMAVAFAQAGGSVLLIDADLRNPSLHKEFAMPNHLGLSNYLAGDAKPAEMAQGTQIKNLFVITAGPNPPNPAELLSSGKMVNLLQLAAERFDQVIIDGPPVLGLADALILSNLAKGTLLVINAGVSRIGTVSGAVKRLRQARAPLVGAVLAKYGQGSSGYGYDYDYRYKYQNYYSYDSDHSEPTAIAQAGR